MGSEEDVVEGRRDAPSALNAFGYGTTFLPSEADIYASGRIISGAEGSSVKAT